MKYDITITDIDDNAVARLNKYLSLVPNVSISSDSESVSISADIYDSATDLVCDNLHIVRSTIAEALAEYIHLDRLEALIKKTATARIKKGKLSYKVDDVVKHMYSMEDEVNFIGSSQKINCISRNVYQYLDTHDIINIGGFINFGLKWYTDEIQFLIDLTLEEMTNMAEYVDFVKLLKYFTNCERHQCDEIHISMSGTGITVTMDGKTLPPGIGNVLDVEDISIDDILVSVLISINPRKIIIHGIPDTPCSELIKQVYGSAIIDVE